MVAPDGSWLASADQNEVRIWDLVTGTTRHTLTGHTGAVSALVAATDGSWLATIDYDGEMWIWDPVTGTTRHTLTNPVLTDTTGPIFTGITSGVRALVVTPDGSWLATIDYDGAVQIWDLVTGTIRHTLTSHTGEVRAVVVAPDGSWLATGGADGTVRIWDSITGAALTSLRVAGGLSHLLLTSTTIAAAGEHGLYFLALCHRSPSG